MLSTGNWLILVPTEMECSLLVSEVRRCARVEICGFGPIVAAARAAELISSHQPDKILLCGIAGSYSDELEIGKAYRFLRVACHGVGTGHGKGFQNSDQMGWPQYHSDQILIGNQLEMMVIENSTVPRADLLVSVCAASANPENAGRVKSLYGDAAAEDMEGFSVAIAARIANVPAAVVRGISNVAGDRNRENWSIERAMQSVNNAVLELITA